MKNRNDENDSKSDDTAEAETEENTEDESGADDLSPGPKRGERPDNLQRRSDWFQKRTGGKQ